MPKTNHAGATYAGQQGIVENAVGELSELDPSRNVDGSVVDGFESDDREIDDIENENPAADPTAVRPADAPDRKNEDAPEEEDNREREPAPKKTESEKAETGEHPVPQGRSEKTVAQPRVASERGTAKSPTSVQKSSGRAAQRTGAGPNKR